MSYLTMQNKVMNRARQGDTWARDRVKEYLNRAQDEVWAIAKEWKQLERDYTATAVVGQEHYTFPEGFIRPLFMKLVDGDSNEYVLMAVEPDSVMSSLARSQGNERPTAYCVRYQQIFFNKKFLTADTIFMSYLGEPTDMTEDSDTTPFSAKEFVLEEFAFGFLMRDLGRTKEFEASYMMFQKMLEDYADSDGRNTDQAEGFFDGRDGVNPYWNEKGMWS